jgi:adenosylhomocysteine nucleosidase
MIAVTFALPSESKDFVRRLGVGREGIKVLHTGVGAAVARTRLKRFLDSEPVEFLVSSGFAGGTEPSLGVGDLLLADNVSDPELLARARDLLKCRVGTLASADRILETAEERVAFARQHGALAADMETETIAQACARRNIPHLSLRVISDTASAPFPAPAAVLFDIDAQKTDPLRLARHLLRYPSTVVRLMEFARQIAGARAKLAAALDKLLLSESRLQTAPPRSRPG